MPNKVTIYSGTAFYIVCALIFISPLMRGAVNPWAHTILQVGTLSSGILLILEKFRFRQIQLQKNPLYGPTLMFGGLTALSFIFSKYRPLALEGLVMILTYTMVFFVTSHAMRTRKQQKMLVVFIITTAVVVSVIGMVKRLDLFPLPFWRYPEIDPMLHPGAVSGPYVNRNHLAGFLEMVIPFTLILPVIKRRSPETSLILFLLAFFLILTQILTLSRGGLISLSGAMLFFTMILAAQYKKHQLKIVSVSVVIGAVVLLMVLLNVSSVERFAKITDLDRVKQSPGRLLCWKGTANSIKDNWLLGTGINTFKESYPAYQLPGASGLEHYTHNDYLNYISELGILVIPIMAWAIWSVFKTGFKALNSRSRQKRGFATAGMAGIVAILIHSLFDFNLYIPANEFLFIMLSVMVTCHPRRVA